MLCPLVICVDVMVCNMSFRYKLHYCGCIDEEQMRRQCRSRLMPQPISIHVQDSESLEIRSHAFLTQVVHTSQIINKSVKYLFLPARSLSAFS